jgi:DNA-binding MarR family transcriptional regulator
VSDASPDLTRIAEVNRVLHEPTRLQITALLYTLESAEFIFVMNHLGLTWGNLSAHLSKLEEAGYVEITKGYKGKRPQTTLHLTEEGRAAFREYAQSMRDVLRNLPV